MLVTAYIQIFQLKQNESNYMNRPIKFRAWDGKKMLDEIRLTAAHGIRLVSSSDLAEHEVSDDAYVFMQFTGLLDAKGKEIYEGDILSRKSEYAHSRQVEVRWDESMSMWNAYLGNTSQGGLWKNVRGEEIIGNIYENSDLLK